MFPWFLIYCFSLFYVFSCVSFDIQSAKFLRMFLTSHFFPAAHYAARGSGVTCAALGKARTSTTGHFYSSAMV